MQFIPVALLLLAFGLCAVRQMHFFQLNSYKFAEHKVWLKRNAFDLIILAALSLISLVALAFKPLGTVIFLSAVIAVYALLSIPKSKKKSKKPLVYTPRVIRMLIAEAIIFIFILVPLYFFIPVPIIASVILLIAPYACLVANLTNAPIEKAIRNSFTKEAISMLRSHPDLRVVGITGSYGKTSTKYYLSTILSERFDVLMTPGSFNTPMGVVRTVREQLRPTHQVFICEMGAKYVGDIKELCEIAEPEIGIISSIGAQHLETFGSLENIVSTKLELYDYLRQKGGVSVLNGDCALIKDNVAAGDGVILYGENGDLKISSVSADCKGTSFTVSYKDLEPFTMSVSLLGAHNVSNLAGAIAVAIELGMTPDEIKRAARKIKCAPHRLEIKQAGKDVIIDDAYNANPAGTKAALAALSLFEGYCKIIVTPGMVELGADSDSFNKALGADAAKVADYIFLVGSYGSDIIRSGAAEAGYPEEKIFIYSKVEDAINAARAIPSQLPRVILLENDLPDNY